MRYFRVTFPAGLTSVQYRFYADKTPLTAWTSTGVAPELDGEVHVAYGVEVEPPASATEIRWRDAVKTSYRTQGEVRRLPIMDEINAQIEDPSDWAAVKDKIARIEAIKVQVQTWQRASGMNLFQFLDSDAFESEGRHTRIELVAPDVESVKARFKEFFLVLGSGTTLHRKELEFSSITGGVMLKAEWGRAELSGYGLRRGRYDIALLSTYTDNDHETIWQKGKMEVK
jgi:hypothetical protein